MEICTNNPQPTRDEIHFMCELLPLENAHVLELGCGRGEKIRQLALASQLTKAVAAEVDPIAHQHNLQQDIPRVEFAHFGAEDIPAPDASFDIVIMMKSLHHVPADLLNRAFAEIARALKPNGWLYISEPVFAGDLNEVIRLFHDEQAVRQAAFAATVEAVDSGRFRLQHQHFFYADVKLTSFDQFEAGIINATHTDHNVDGELLALIREKFESHRQDNDPPFQFKTPNRVDLLRLNPT